MWKNIRVACLLIILVIVAVNAWRDMNQDWNKPITVLLHPINADARPATAHYIQQLSIDDLEEMQRYLQTQSKEFRGQPTQFYFQLGRELKKIPPKVPESNSILSNIWWSLKFRYYAWQQHERGDGSPSVTLYLNYYDPQYIKQLKHSVALERGRIGSVNLFASTKQSGSNKVVLVHELLHAFGAKDKYDLQTGQPIYPLGYADPEQNPLYPQHRAEIMGGYIPLNAKQSQTPDSLSDTMISRATAQEIDWVK
ncbi:hypothetical protein [Acinetobacter silvestris]|uniref:Uncharacterized protein n=1 Tax=Acinetobacter silvestris TaxID=1977882 RepID=A0A1Y3CJW8_9GAMM|nr:hypothetical protein [Acinetobacter silvestris]OTG67410.1 hypothetical protein B9T28_01930 [Acinetobacter silvestris]